MESMLFAVLHWHLPDFLFVALKMAGDAWQGGTAWPDPKLGWLQLTATGGHEEFSPLTFT